MASASSEYYSIKITRLIMRTAGVWIGETERERLILNASLAYALFAVLVALCIQVQAFYYTWGDFYAFTYTACSMVPVLIILVKACTYVLRREEVNELIRYTQENFWYKKYDAYGERILKEIDKKGILLVCSFTFFVQGVVVAYTLTPIVENVGKNETDRILPFTLWIDIPSTTTPYFEVIFVIQTLSLVHSGICFCCFDNFLYMICIHAAAQFKILQHRLETIFEVDCMQKSTDSLKLPESPERVYNEFKSCILQHHELIQYMGKLEQLYSYTILCQLLISSVMLCIAGFQIVVGSGSLVRKTIFISYITGSFFQIFATTHTINEVIVESRAVGDAVYKCNWESSSYKLYRSLRGNILMIMERAKRPCYISAGGFSPVSLETFTAVLSTAASYFTLLRKFNMEFEET